MAGSSVGELIKKYRRLRKLTQDQLAFKIPVSQQMLQKYEAGKSQVKVEMLLQIARALEVPASALLAEEPEYIVAQGGQKEKGKKTIPLKVTEEEVILVTAYRKMKSEKIKETFLSLLNTIAELGEAENK